VVVELKGIPGFEEKLAEKNTQILSDAVALERRNV